MNKETVQEKQIRMYGETVEEMREGAMFTKLDDPASLVMYAMGILSDAQEELILGDPERARKYMNKAKYFMSEANYILRSKR